MDSGDGARPDSTLVEEFRKGSSQARQGAFCALYERYAGPVRSYLARLGRRPELAEDLTQETFLRALNGLDGFDGRSSVKSWIYCIATNLFRDHLKRRSTMTQEGASDWTDREGKGPTPAEVAERNEEAERVRTAVEALPDEYRAPVILVRLEGMSYAEAADVLGATVPAVRMRIHRGHLRLLEALRDK